jgi:hypothetical protein
VATALGYAVRQERPLCARKENPMMRDVYDRLLLRRLEPRWVGNEVHVDVHGRAFALTDYPGGVGVRTLTATAPVVFRHPDDAIVALGLV